MSTHVWVPQILLLMKQSLGDCRLTKPPPQDCRSLTVSVSLYYGCPSFLRLSHFPGISGSDRDYSRPKHSYSLMKCRSHVEVGGQRKPPLP